MTDLIIWLLALVAIIYLLFVNMLLRDQNKLIKQANKILHDCNEKMLHDMIKFNENMWIVKIEFDNLCRELNNDHN